MNPRATALALLLSCGGGAVPAGVGRDGLASQPAALAVALPPTTASAIALGNLDGSIAALLAKQRGLTPARAGELVELLLTRGRFLGRIDDYERADSIAEDAVRREPASAPAYLARAATAATFHRFREGLADLERAANLGAPQDRIVSARAAIFQATGRYDLALAVRTRLAGERPSITSLGALASLLAERGEIEAAEARFEQALSSYPDVSPFPVAWVCFERGRMWMRAERFDRARVWFAASRQALPEYAAATGHLGEVEAALGRPERALVLLRSAASRSDDPDPAGQLARVLEQAGLHTEAEVWGERARARFLRLLARHPEAFADHGAEFFLGYGKDPWRALALASLNWETKSTPAACTLLAKAAAAAGTPAPACARTSL